MTWMFRLQRTFEPNPVRLRRVSCPNVWRASVLGDELKER